MRHCQVCAIASIYPFQQPNKTTSSSVTSFQGGSLTGVPSSLSTTGTGGERGGGAVSSQLSSKAANKSKLLKKIEERNVSISNAKRRWSFLKEQTCKKMAAEGAPMETPKVATTPSSAPANPAPTQTEDYQHQQQAQSNLYQRPKIINITQVIMVFF